MANGINLDPQLGVELVNTLSQLCDGVLNEIAKQAYADAQLLGQNATTAEFEEKFMAFQQQYNTNVFPAFISIQDTFKEFTNYAELQAAMKVDQSVDQSSAGMAAAEGLGAARSQIGQLSDMIS